MATKSVSGQIKAWLSEQTSVYGEITFSNLSPTVKSGTTPLATISSSTSLTDLSITVTVNSSSSVTVGVSTTNMSPGTRTVTLTYQYDVVPDEYHLNTVYKTIGSNTVAEYYLNSNAHWTGTSTLLAPTSKDSWVDDSNILYICCNNPNNVAVTVNFVSGEAQTSSTWYGEDEFAHYIQTQSTTIPANSSSTTIMTWTDGCVISEAYTYFYFSASGYTNSSQFEIDY